MLGFKTIKNNLKNAIIILEGEIKYICPETKMIDNNKFRIEYLPKDLLIEVITFREYLEGFQNIELYSEDTFQIIEDIINDKINPKELNIELIDDSPGIKIIVKTECKI